MDIIWSKRAELDFFQIMQILQESNPSIVVRFVEKIRNLLLLLKKYLNMGRFVLEYNEPQYREVFWKKYRIIYRIQINIIEIITIYHGSRLLDF